MCRFERVSKLGLHMFEAVLYFCHGQGSLVLGARHGGQAAPKLTLSSILLRDTIIHNVEQDYIFLFKYGYGTLDKIMLPGAPKTLLTWSLNMSCQEYRPYESGAIWAM